MTEITDEQVEKICTAIGWAGLEITLALCGIVLAISMLPFGLMKALPWVLR